MAWTVEYTDEFGAWWNDLSDSEQEDVATVVHLLEERGPTLYAFTPLRNALLLLGGSKAGDDRWYEQNVPIADALYDEHLIELRKEGLLK